MMAWLQHKYASLECLVFQAEPDLAEVAKFAKQCERTHDRVMVLVGSINLNEQDVASCANALRCCRVVHVETNIAMDTLHGYIQRVAA